MGEESRFDVVVVGAGGSGLAAAVSAAEGGARVVALERREEPGGTTRIAVGSFTANRTRMQAGAGISDALDDHADDVGRFAPPEIEARNNADLRRYFLSHGAETLEWLRGLGLAFHGPSPEPPNRVPRMHNVVPGARAYIETLSAKLLELGGVIVCGADVERLRMEGSRVVGVSARCSGEVRHYDADLGVVLAAGDYANAPDLIARHKGKEFARIEGINPHAEGGGHRLVEQAGGALVNMDVTYGPELRFVAPARPSIQQLLPSRGPLGWILKRSVPLVPDMFLRGFVKRLVVTWQHPEDALFTDGAILINSRAERFCNELRSPGREIAVGKQPDRVAYVLLDKRLSRRYREWPHFISTAPRIAYAYVHDYLRLRPDIAVRKGSLEELARSRGLSAEALVATVAAFNRDAEAQRDDRWGRGDARQSFIDGDWVLLGPAKAYFTTTEGGAAIDEQFRVLSPEGCPIEGLHAVGQNGLGGQVLWGHGLHIGWAMTSGRRVGKVLTQKGGS